MPFRPITSAAMQAALRRIAERHGYTATRGPRHGQGNPSELIQALDSGELATVLLDSDRRWHLIQWLDAQAARCADLYLAEDIAAVAGQLRAAADRERAIEDEDSVEAIEERRHGTS